MIWEPFAEGHFVGYTDTVVNSEEDNDQIPLHPKIALVVEDASFELFSLIFPLKFTKLTPLFGIQN